MSVVGFYYFLAHSLTTNEPFVRFEMFKDRNFLSGCVFMVVIGVVLFGTMALVTPFMQNLLGYPIQTAGFLLGARGVGTLLTMMVAPRLMRAVHPRYLILAGLLLAGGTLYYMTGFSLDVTKTTIVVPSIVQGIGLGLLFVPISTVAFATLPDHLRTGATAITTPGPQYRLFDRHIDGHRQLNEQDNGDACAADRAGHSIQRRASNAGRGS